MKLYILKPVKNWQPWYDSRFGCVVRSENEQSARIIASEYGYGDEGSLVWLDNKETSCVELLNEGDQEIIITDFASA